MKYPILKNTMVGVCVLVMLGACKDKEETMKISVKNNLAVDRRAETISIAAEEISHWIKAYGVEHIVIRDGDVTLVSQPIDITQDGVIDEILFQTDIKANAEKTFVIAAGEAVGSDQPQPAITTYSRFVPERIDDYAWENDRVAFRTYGPKAQQLTESGEKGGTLTSGMDCWLKRTRYPVIDKWYKHYLTDPGYYHKDHGEGYDPYHVGNSRGCGGIGVWAGDSLYVSKNFTAYKTLATGPIRTMFELTYAPWDANGNIVNEKKIISLDLGSNLSRFEVQTTSDKPLPSVAIGITLHDKLGDVRLDSVAGYFRYWEPIDSVSLGTGVVLSPEGISSSRDYRTTVKDQSHILVLAKANMGRVVYYAGFGWQKSGQFNTVAMWDAYLADFSKRLSSPLVVKLLPENQ